MLDSNFIIYKIIWIKVDIEPIKEFVFSLFLDVLISDPFTFHQIILKSGLNETILHGFKGYHRLFMCVSIKGTNIYFCQEQN